MLQRILAVAVIFLSSVAAFAPVHAPARSISTAQYALADRIFNLDLFSPKADQNDYGARGKKNLKVGSLTDKSYIPAGLTKAQYEKIRKEEQAKKETNYKRNVAKAFKFQDFTEWYVQRGTDLKKGAGKWVGSATLGHTMAKTKFDWSGTEQAKKFESTNTDKFMASFNNKKKAKAPTKKAAATKRKTFF